MKRVTTITSVDRDYFARHSAKLDYVRDPLPGEFDDVVVPADAYVRVFAINPRTYVKALERPTGERLATVIERDNGTARQDQAA
jgi:hypothetical protein